MGSIRSIAHELKMISDKVINRKSLHFSYMLLYLSNNRFLEGTSKNFEVPRKASKSNTFTFSTSFQTFLCITQPQNLRIRHIKSWIQNEGNINTTFQSLYYIEAIAIFYYVLLIKPKVLPQNGIRVLFLVCSSLSLYS